MNELEKIKTLIDQNETISFDIFDTLLLRNVQKPVDIFKILGDIANKEFGIKDFFEQRIKIEGETRTVENNYETTLDEVYNNFKLDKKQSEWLKNKELELEDEFLIANPFMKKVFDYAKEQKKKILAISDMYLPLSFIEKQLDKKGYGKVKVYLSCDKQKHKGDGSIFLCAKEEEHLEESKWLHIGDNKWSDYDMPRQLGINAYNYIKVQDRGCTPESENISASIINAINNNAVNNGLDVSYWEKFGKYYAAPIYYAFSNFVYNHNKDRDNVCFMARDGYIVQKVFDKIAKKNNLKIDSKYIYTSRRAIQLPALLYYDKTYAINNLTSMNEALHDKKTIRDMLNYFDLGNADYEKIVKKYDFDSVDDNITRENQDKCRQFFSEIYMDVQKKMNEKVNLIKKYFIQEGLLNYKRVNIVDIGWRGSVQYAISKIFPDMNIYGYYFGTTSEVYSEIFYNTIGFASNYSEPERIFDHLNENIMMYEFLFSSPEGSLKGFKEEKGKIIPMLDSKTEYGDNMKELQDSALNIIDTYLKYHEYIQDYNASDAIYNYKLFIENKNYQDQVAFNNVFTNVGYSGDQTPFVKKFKFDELSRHENEFQDQVTQSLWLNTYLFEECSTEEEYLKLKKQLQKELKKQYKKDYTLWYRIKRHIYRKLKKYIKIAIKLARK